MRILIASSRNWYSVDRSIQNEHAVKFVTSRLQLSKDNLDDFSPDIVFFPHWNWAVPADIYDSFKCVVFHTAPLPYGRGGSPIQNLILRGFQTAPVCALQMGPILDGGGIYDKCEIDLNGSLKDIFDRMNLAVNSLIIRIVKNDLTPSPQKGEVVTFKRLTSEDNQLVPGLSLKQFYDRIRMLDHDEYPNAFIIFDNYKIEFLNVKAELDGLVCHSKISLIEDGS